MANRIRNKLQPRVPNIPRRGQTAVMGEINRSIEKMSLGDGSSGVKGLTDSKSRGVMMGNMRRDSSWTVSTEGYGSMRSNTSASRRCSELSQVRPDWKYNIATVSDNIPLDVHDVSLGSHQSRQLPEVQRGRSRRRSPDVPGSFSPSDQTTQESSGGRNQLQPGPGNY